MMKYLYIFFILLSTQATAQKLKKAEKKIVENLKTEITYLSSDALQGRRAGSEGEKLAYQYLSDQFKAIGLIPKGDNNSYLQAFTINEGKEILPATHFIINDTSLKSGKDFFPLIVSGNGKAGGDVSPAFKEKGMPWFWDIKETLAQNEDNPHFDIVESAKQQALNIQKKGASALIVFNSDNEDDDLHFDAKSKMEAVNIPVVYLSKKMAAKYLSDNAANLNVDLEVAIGEKTSTAHNVIGYIDNGARSTIILGAHYDHQRLGH